MTYTLTSPLPSIQNHDKVSEGLYFTGTRIMWYDAIADETRLLATFGGFTDNIWRAMYVNLTTGAHNLVDGGSGAVWNGAYNPSNRKLYCGAAYGMSLTEFDPLATPPAATVINDTDVGQYCDLRLGKDDRLYYATFGVVSNRFEIHSYDPSVGLPTGWKHYPDITDGAGESHVWADADADYVYVAYQKSNGKYTLVSSPNTGTPAWTEWTYGSLDSDTFVIIRRDTSGDLFAHRTRADDADRYYYLSGGGPGTELETQPDRPILGKDDAAYNCISASDETIYNQFNTNYGYDVDFNDLFPIKTIHEYSNVGYKLHADSEYTYTGQESYTGPWVAMTVIGMVAKSNSIMFCLTATYNAASLLTYNNMTYPDCTTYLGSEIISPYVVKKHPTSGEYYGAGYSNKMWRYDPSASWTLTNATAATHVPGDSGKPNPYLCYLGASAPILHYRFCLDFDHNGYVWLGGNTTRESTDYANVMWYKPTDGSVDYIFDSWQAAGTMIMSLCSCLSRTKILVSDNKDNIYKVNTDTRASEDSTTVLGSGTSKSIMLEASNDRVFVVTIDVGSVYRVGLFKPSDMTWVVEPKTLGVGITGQPFGFEDGQYTRMFWKLELGPDGFIWMYVGSTLYRIDPTDPDLTFNSIATTGKAAITFAYNNLDLILYNINGGADRGDPNVKYYPGILTFEGYSKGAYPSLPGNDDDLLNIYTDGQIIDVAADDTDMVAQLATSQIAIHQFKQQMNGIGGIIDVVAQVTIPCSTSTTYLQIYNRSGAPAWETIDSDNATGANTDFTLSATVADLTDYKDINNIVACRVYQEMQ